MQYKLTEQELEELYEAVDNFNILSDPEENKRHKLKLHYKQKHKQLEAKLNAV